MLSLPVLPYSAILATVGFPRYPCVVSSDEWRGPRAELRDVLEEQRGIIDRLLAGVADSAVSAVQLAHWADWLERLDDRRDALIRALREEATESRKREEERSVRQFVLRALGELDCHRTRVSCRTMSGPVTESIWIPGASARCAGMSADRGAVILGGAEPTSFPGLT